MLLCPFCAKDWESSSLPGVLASTVTPAFDSDPEISDVDEDEPGGLVGSVDAVSPGGHSDAQTLAMMLQEQLDAINEEIRLVWQEEEAERGEGAVRPGHSCVKFL